jgi:hypothetical protein
VLLQRCIQSSHHGLQQLQNTAPAQPPTQSPHPRTTTAHQGSRLTESAGFWGFPRCSHKETVDNCRQTGTLSQHRSGHQLTSCHGAFSTNQSRHSICA